MLPSRTHLDGPLASPGANVQDPARVLQGRIVVAALEQHLEDLIL